MVARYPGMGAPNPLMGMAAPNAALFQGGQYGQAQFVAGEPVMPSGFVFEGVRFFETTNMPSKTATVDIGDGSGAVAGRSTPLDCSSVLRQLALVSVARTLRS